MSFIRSSTTFAVLAAVAIAVGLQVAACWTTAAGRPALVALAGFSSVLFVTVVIIAVWGHLRAERHLAMARRRITKLERELAEANTDPVTGLVIRRLAEQRLASMSGSDLTVALIDVDDMHGINERHSHFGGDVYLAAVANRLAGQALCSELVARLGGDEFVVVSWRTPQALAETLVGAMSRPVTINDSEVSMRLSVGISGIHGGDVRVALERADNAMYTAKRRHSVIEFYDAASDGPPLGNPPRVVRPQRLTRGGVDGSLTRSWTSPRPVGERPGPDGTAKSTWLAPDSQ
jgi:diguanylate cyclase (GGDEF)-like protein